MKIRLDWSAPRWKRLRRMLGLAGVTAAATLVALLVMYGVRAGALRARVLEHMGALADNAYFHLVTEPFEIRVGTDARAAEIDLRLERAGYARVAALPKRGEFQVTSRAISVYTREADAGARLVVLRLSGDIVSGILVDGRDQEVVALPGEHLTSFRDNSRERRTPLLYADLPDDLVRAAIAAEDRRFFTHRGLDGRGIVRALIHNLRAGRIVEGGSTITQQTVKLILEREGRAVHAKMDEALLALSVERRFSKQQILQVYLNEVYFGHDGPFAVHGVAEGAYHLFGKPVAALNVDECVRLAATIRAPNARSPRRNAKQLAAYAQAITTAMQAVSLPPTATASNAEPESRRQPFLCNAARRRSRVDFTASQVGYFFDRLDREWMQRRDEYRLMPPATLICSLDPVLQQHAAGSLQNGLQTAQTLSRRASKRLQGALVVADVRTGALRAVVGGSDYVATPFNRALDASRSVGSTFKPVVYLAAFGGLSPETHLSQSTILPDEPRQYRVGRQTWQPTNHDGEYNGWVTARTALAKSLNAATVALGMDVGVRSVARLAVDLGITDTQPENPSILLGALAASPVRLAAAYAAIANGGESVTPHALVAVQREDERHEFASKRKRVLDPRVCYVVTDMLVNALKAGTGHAAHNLGFTHVAAGKTGTTDDARDAWFVGFTPDLVAAVWVGHDNNTPTGLGGARAALPIWVRFMRGSLGQGWEREFVAPPGIVFRQIDPASGDLAQRRCPQRDVAAYLEEAAPEWSCGLHGSRRWTEPRDSEWPDRLRGLRKKRGLWDRFKEVLGV